MNAMPGTLSRYGEMQTVLCMSIHAANGAVCSVIFISHAGRFFLKMTTDSLDTGKEFDPVIFDKYIRNWEWEWVNKRKDYPVEPSGKSIDQVIMLYNKYNHEIPRD